MNLTRKQIVRFREKLQNVPLIQELIDIGREKGREEGRPRGREDRQAVLARRLLWEEVSKADVGELTGASETMIEAIYQDMLGSLNAMVDEITESGRFEGRKIGYEEGASELTIKVAKALLAHGFSMEMVQDVTELTKEEIEIASVN